ncbi:MAG: pilus assembly protein PilP [Pseudomonadota bacterium]
MKLRRTLESNYSKIHILLLFMVLFFSFTFTSSLAKSQSSDTLIKSQKTIFEKKDIANNKKVKNQNNSVSLRDPFKPFIFKKTEDKNKRAGERLTPLQRYNLNQLKLTGIIWGDEGNTSVAMIEDPEGKGYVLKKGTLIGENNGRIINILKDRVIIREEYRNYRGGTNTKTTSLKLHKAEEGETP